MPLFASIESWLHHRTRCSACWALMDGDGLVFPTKVGTLLAFCPECATELVRTLSEDMRMECDAMETVREFIGRLRG